MDLNQALIERAQHVIPGGVNSPVRAFGSVGGAPRFIERAKGPYMWDVTDKRFTDYVCSWGPMILGHNDPEVVETVHAAVDRGLSFGAATRAEVEIAEMITNIFLQWRKFVSSPPARRPACRRFVLPAGIPAATASSSLRAVTTVIPMHFW